MNKRSVFIFRNDLRLKDNPGLTAASQQSGQCFPVYILSHEKKRLNQEASGQYLIDSLRKLDDSLRENGSALLTLENEESLSCLIKKEKIDAVYWNADGDPHVDRQLHRRHEALKDRVDVHVFPASQLVDPNLILTMKENPYQVFTPFWKRLQKEEMEKPLGKAQIKPLDCIPKQEG